MQDLKEKLSGLTLEEKIEFLEKCENKETNETLSYQLGICYFMLDDNNKALIWLKKTLALNDNHTDALKCIEAIKASMSTESYTGYLKGNVQKYVWRYEDKNGVEDLRKAQWYLNTLIDVLWEE